MIEKILKSGESVSIKGFGSFHIAGRKFTHPVSEKRFFRYLLSKYIPKHLLRKETIEKEQEEESEELE